jgi:two-component system, OmpR family, osmolarity sensor histidine kinase EnvZ
MLKSLRARNVALMAGMLFLGQLLTLAMVAGFVIGPQADRIAAILGRNVRMVGTTLNALPANERAAFIIRVNNSGTFRIIPGGGETPGADGRPTWLETRVLRSLAADLGQSETMVWRGGGGQPLWVWLRLGSGEPYWVSLAPSPGWTPTGALFGAVAIGLTLSLIAGLVLQRRINRPLKALADAVDAMPDPQSVAHLADEAPAEIATVATSFERMAARLRAQEADRAFMLAGISHDLKTPIAKLRLAAALRETGDADDDAMIARQFERIERMLDQFLDFGRGTEAELPAPAALVPTIAEIARALGLSPDAISGDPTLAASVRPVAFERAIANLIRNAMVHGQPPVSVAVTQADSAVTICVTDKGSGVSEEILTQLGRPFLRGDAARPSDGGVGLGLAIAARFAHEHGGTLHFANVASGGFQATLVIPRS